MAVGSENIDVSLVDSGNAWVLIVLVSTFTFGLAVSSCSSSQKQCDPATPKVCSDNKCHQCCVASDCPPVSGIPADQIACSAEFTCMHFEENVGADCSADPPSCWTGLICDKFSRTCQYKCQSSEECVASHPDLPFKDDLFCIDGLCDFECCCSGCRAGTVCYDGDCVKPADCNQVKSCSVVPATAVTQQNLKVGFAATAFLQSGALAPGVDFSWTSSAADKAAVDSSGVVTGGASSGTATITATVTGCSTTCNATVTNYSTPVDTRVVVIDELAGTPIAAADVVVGSQAAIKTDALGIANFTGVTPPNDVSVFKADYDYVTVKGVQTNDIIIHVGKIIPADQCGGFRGDFNFDLITCGPSHPCEVKLGLAGSSIPGSLVNLNFYRLLGDSIKTHIELGGNRTDVGLPGGMVLGLNTTWFKQHLSPSGAPGRRVAWGMGGKIDLSVVIDKLGPILFGGTGNVDTGALLAAMLPLFNSFYTSLEPNVEIGLQDKVIDVNDINGNGKTDDLVCDFDNFPTLAGGGMTLKVKMDQTMTFSVPNLTKACKDTTGADVYCYDGVIILAGVIVKDAGLVPLGLSAGLDKKTKDDVADGVIEPISVAISDVAGRIPESQVKRVVVALALNIENLTGSSGSVSLAGQVKFIDAFTGSVTLDPFMNPSVATLDLANRKLTFKGVSADADYLQAIFSDSDGNNWHMLADKSVTELDLPVAPTEGDRAAKANFVAINLRSDTSFQDLPKFGSGKNLGNLVELVQAFSFVEAASQ